MAAMRMEKPLRFAAIPDRKIQVTARRIFI